MPEFTLNINHAIFTSTDYLRAEDHELKTSRNAALLRPITGKRHDPRLSLAEV